MAICRGCDTEGDGNFCADCGLPLSDTSPGSAAVGLDAPTLMGAAGPPKRASETLRTGSRSRSAALGIALLGFLGAGSYAALRSPAPESVPEVAVDEIGDEEGAPENDDTSSVRATDNLDDLEEPSVFDDSFWFEGDSQWYIIVSAQGSLHRIDTRTGIAIDLELPGYPLGRLGDKILVASEGRLVITDEVALTSDPPVELPEPLDVNIAVGGPFWLTEGLNEDYFWLQRYDSALEIDLRSGTLRREIRNREPYLGPFPSYSPDFRTPLSGGVYRLDPDEETVSYQRMMDGRIVAQSNGALLVSSCGLELVCEHRWVDQITMEPRTDLVAPAFEEDSWFVGGVLADGRFVGTVYGRFMNVTNGTTFLLNEAKMNSMFSGELEISPDGKVIAHLSRSRLQVQSIGSSVAETSDLQALRSNTRPLFIAISES
jgi:hypothetical protein